MDIQKELKEKGISIIYSYDLDTHGLYIPEVNSIMINGYLKGVEIENAILHELGHLVNGHEFTSLSAPTIHIKQEAEADKYWINERVKDFLSLYDSMPEYVDIYRFLNVYHIKSCYYDIAEELFKEYLTYEK
ncbi:hypothetical protein BG262_02675 [Floricoccus penangensis]|uniref:IrrE N-terminal-like domain-containing protein n=1 Tax=Floricoccus penangensis TaxID=1859475 RepID=A0A9Q5JGM4_9LACT|nr:hypothetical protein [Floricoccus penangensis]OFI46720.1 hypothetical protein BG262_02675 [Floricoccus penangensis]